MKRIVTILLALCMIVVIGGCGNKNDSSTTISTHTKSQYVQSGAASERTKGWFDNAVANYIDSVKNGLDYKIYTNVFDVRNGVNEENVLSYVSAEMSMYVNAEGADKQDIADFSDNFARYFAELGASGDIQCSIYITPTSVYEQVEEGNHTQVEEKATGMDGYYKFSFSYGGIGDAIELEKNANQSVESESKTKNDKSVDDKNSTNESVSDDNTNVSGNTNDSATKSEVSKEDDKIENNKDIESKKQPR